MNGECGTDGRMRYIHVRLLSLLGAVNDMPDIRSAGLSGGWGTICSKSAIESERGREKHERRVMSGKSARLGSLWAQVRDIF